MLRLAASLCLQAQCIIFRRYPEVLAPFKYAGYPMLLQAVALPPDESQDSSGSHFLAEERTPRLQVGLFCIAKILLHANRAIVYTSVEY